MTKVDVWESEIYLSLKKRERLAWFVAIVASIIALLSVTAVIFLTPLKTIEPVIITVDKYTGNANLTSQINSVTVSDEEAIAQALVHQYVRDRETYDNQDQRERINKVARFSADQTIQDLRQLYDDNNPLNPINRYGAATRITVTINSIVIDQENRMATVRLTKTLVADGSADSEAQYVATMTFEFDRSKDMTLAKRWENPTGFAVTNYRIDAEAR